MSLIVAAHFEAGLQARLDGMREAYFPSGRNIVPAHVTLFHNLPTERSPEIAALVKSRLPSMPPTAVATCLKFLGQGCAYTIEATELAALRHELAEKFAADLTLQDRQPWRLHVTIQNKAPAAEAKALFTRLSAEFGAISVRFETVTIWTYRSGQWLDPVAIRFD